MGDGQPRTRFASWAGALALVATVLLVLGYAGTREAKHSPAGAAAVPRGSVPVAAAQGRPPGAPVTGVAVGYPRTRAGAQSAAANYTTAYGSSAMFRTASRRELIAAIGDPAGRAALSARADAAFGAQTAAFGLDPEGNAPNGLAFVCRVLPVGTRVAAYSPDAATVEVWGAGLVGLAGAGSSKPVSEAWTTTTMRLTWAADDWKLVDFSQKEGPTPVSGLQSASGAEEIAQAVRDFEELSYAR
ncbi:hypothetical protein [Yinghuangia seranimata]|uniref:hypothetical protein n=1 Tax=Yinghuangia seranimata TaxID=408067 RepID=UPI00248C5504|nr:hypothetical protein [Yinghuangia seranimata]MDI2132640.1 hypothetical protein [Yinghuangia seranimata]